MKVTTLVKQVNLNRSPNAMTYQVESLKGISKYILLLSEPSMRQGKLVGKPRGAQLFPRCGDEKQRAVIILDRTIVGTEIVELTTKD